MAEQALGPALDTAFVDLVYGDDDLVRLEFEAIVGQEAWGDRDAVDDDTGVTGDAPRGGHQPRAPRYAARLTPADPLTRSPRRERSPPAGAAARNPGPGTAEGPVQVDRPLSPCW